MLGIGFLALFTVGIAMSAGGGDDAEIENTENDTDVELDEDGFFVDENGVSVGPLGIEYFPPDDVDPETEQRINDFIQAQRDEPGLRIEDAVDQLNAFLAELEAEAEEEPPVEEPTAPEEPEEIVRPPFGDQFNDPSLNPPQTIFPPEPEEEEEEEIVEPMEPAVPPEELVTVTTNIGSEFADSAVLSEGPTSGENADRDFIVSTSTVSNDILVDYDSQTTFLIEYSDETETVTASLNSNIQGPPPGIDETRSLQTDDDGNDFTQISTSLNFTDSASITLNVSEEQIGTHVSQIDLQNPRDTLNFNFDTDVTGNLHLVYNDDEQDTGSDTSTTRTLYVIETPASVASLSAADIAHILSEDGNSAQDTRLVAEVHLGGDSLTLDGDPASRLEYTVTIVNAINDDPRINTNVEWASVGEHDGTVPADDNADDGTDGSDDGEDFDFGFNFPTFNNPNFGI